VQDRLIPGGTTAAVEGFRAVGAPSGTVTFLFTDIEGSTRLWEHEPEAMRAALARHDVIVRGAIEAHGGYVFATGGDGFAAAFARPPDAIAAAESAQATLREEAWPDGAALRVRMGVHTGVVEERDGDYFGAAVNRAARLMAIAHGGQILCSSVTAGLLDGPELADLGEHLLRDLSGPQRVFQAGAGEFPHVQSLDAFASNLPAQATAFRTGAPARRGGGGALRVSFGDPDRCWRGRQDPAGDPGCCRLASALPRRGLARGPRPGCGT
jgi:class 3 adenylate cyclase